MNVFFTFIYVPKSILILKLLFWSIKFACPSPIYIIAILCASLSELYHEFIIIINKYHSGILCFILLWHYHSSLNAGLFYKSVRDVTALFGTGLYFYSQVYLEGHYYFDPVFKLTYQGKLN